VLLALPVMVVTAAVLVRWRTSRGGARRVAFRRSLAEVGVVAGTLPWLWMVLAPGTGGRRVALVPFRDLVDLFRAGPATVVVQVGGNLLVLAAFGAFLPMRFAVLDRLWRVGVVSAAAAVTLEVLQYVLDLGRVTSVDDVLVNTTGAVVAALLTRRWRSDTVALGDRYACGSPEPGET
jgi:glycopeptide antibiotics resistance protein